MSYQIQEGVFDASLECVDHTVNVLIINIIDALPLNIMITRTKVSSETTLTEYAAADIMISEDRDGFDLIWKRTYAMGGRPALILAATRGHGDTMVELRRIHTKNDTYIITITCTTLGNFTQPQLDGLNEFVRSFRFVA